MEPFGSWQDISRAINANVARFEQEWNTPVADVFRSIWADRDALFWGVRDNVINNFSALEQSLNPDVRNFLQANSQIAQQVLPEIDQQAQLVREVFWPGGRFATQADNIFNRRLSLANNAIAGRQQAAQNQLGRAWVSQGIGNNFTNRIRQEGQAEINDLISTQLEEQQRLFNNLNTLTTDLRNQRVDQSNRFLIEPLQEVFNIRQWLANSLNTSLGDVNNLEASEIAAIQNQGRADEAATTLFDRNVDIIWINNDNSVANAKTAFDNLLERDRRSNIFATNSATTAFDRQQQRDKDLNALNIKLAQANAAGNIAEQNELISQISQTIAAWTPSTSTTNAASWSVSTPGWPVSALSWEVAWRLVTLAEPAFRALQAVDSALKRAWSEWIKTTQSFRTGAQQDAIYNQWRTTPWPIVTYTRDSVHEHGNAVDVWNVEQQIPDWFRTANQYIAYVKPFMEAAGWVQPYPWFDPGHFEFRGNVA